MTVPSSQPVPVAQAESREAHETSPLLSDERQMNDDNEDDPHSTLDKNQIYILSICRIADPIAFFCIIPFINYMIEDMGYREEDVGYYTGLIESLFSIVQMIMMVPYGKVADRIGRRPVLLFSMAGLCVACTLFGFSQSLWQVILLRCAAGFFSGSVVSIRSMISENSTPDTEAWAFSIFAFCGNVGIFGGTFVGALAKPAEQFGGVFKRLEFFRRFPYAVPTMVSGFLVLCMFVMALFFVKETVHKGRKKDSKKDYTTLELISAPGVPLVLFVWSISNLLGFAFTAGTGSNIPSDAALMILVAPVYWFTSVHLGGFGFKPAQISLFLALGGISQALWMLVVFPSLHGRINTRGILRVCGIVWPFLFALNPAANLALRAHLTAFFWVVGPVVVVLGSGCAMAFTASQLAVNSIVPDPAALGTLNGIALSMAAGIRAFTPGLFGSILATGVSKAILGGQLVWLVMILATFVFSAAVSRLSPKADIKGSDEPLSDSDSRGIVD